MKSLRTATDVRAHLLQNWRKLFPDLLVPHLQVSPAPGDSTFVQVALLDQDGPVRQLLFVPLASGEPRLLKALLPRLRQLNSSPATRVGLAVPHMGAAGLKVCREAGIGFVDCCGNAHLRFNRVIVQIAGNRNKFAPQKRVRTLFHDKATIPLRILLDAPDVWLTTREIAERGSLSLGWVSQILQQLNAGGYVERKRGGGTRLLHPRRLLQDWLAHYAFEQNEVYPFRLRGGGVATALDCLRTLPESLASHYALTLQAAISALSEDTEPSELHLYLPDLHGDKKRSLETWGERLDLRPAGLGADCFLIRPAYAHGIFFGRRRSSGLQLVSDLQLYLDLYHYPVVPGSQARTAVASRLPFALETEASATFPHR
ncbi:MAG: hypothetical protein ACE5HV_09395 [Acidobacteriota bacterium]